MHVVWPSSSRSFMYLEVSDAAPAKSTEKTMDTLGMTEDEFDPTPVTMTNNQGDIPSFGQQDVKSQFPISENPDAS